MSGKNHCYTVDVSKFQVYTPYVYMHTHVHNMQVCVLHGQNVIIVIWQDGRNTAPYFRERRLLTYTIFL